MLISRNWLQSYFTTELPDAQTLADTLMLHAFEIEGVEPQGDDWIIDVDVLPNRAHDCLCHLGFVNEVATLLNLTAQKPEFPELTMNAEAFTVRVENTEQCLRYQATLVHGVAVGDSHSWLQEKLQAMGQKSINNLVDMTNVIMFDAGQPMHVFDADKIAGGITVRNAQEGEMMTTLSGEELELLASDLVIADDEGILALAGVKGGTKAEVDENTKNIVIESANFNPTTTRKTARRVKILTDASKRYENGISSEKVSYATREMLMMIGSHSEMANHEVIGTVDIYPQREQQETVQVHLEHIQRLLGLEISEIEISDIFDRLGFEHRYEDTVFNVTVPFERLDLRIPEDIIEEIGRVYGYHTIPTKSLDDYVFEPELRPLTYISHVLRNAALENGFTELMTYSFVNKGDVELFNPIASDKKALRKNIQKLFATAMEKNARNADYFGKDVIKSFEIGKVYRKDAEETHAVFAVHNTNKKARKTYGTEEEQLLRLHEQFQTVLGCSFEASIENNIMSFSVDDLATQVSLPQDYGEIFKGYAYDPDSVFTTISPYQYVTRDVSFWTPESNTEEILREVIASSGTQFLKKIFLFDRFEKEGRVSYAFSLVFQSDEKTLTDQEVEADMNLIQDKLQGLGCEVR